MGNHCVHWLKWEYTWKYSSEILAIYLFQSSQEVNTMQQSPPPPSLGPDERRLSFKELSLIEEGKKA